MKSITITLKVITITIVITFVLKHLQNENKSYLYDLMYKYINKNKPYLCGLMHKYIFRQQTIWVNTMNEITNL